MKSIIIDTNVLYHITKISENNKVSNNRLKRLITCSEFYITTISIIESIIKYRGDLIKIKKILKPIEEKKIKIIKIGYMPLSSETIFKIVYAKKLPEINKEINEIFNIKIFQEVEFSLLFFYNYCMWYSK